MVTIMCVTGRGTHSVRRPGGAKFQSEPFTTIDYCLPLVVYSVLTADHPSLTQDMSQSSSPSTFQGLFNAALQDYKDKTGSSLVDHPFATQLQECDSVESISTALEDQARIFREFRDHGKLVNSLNRLANILCSPLISEGIGLVVRPKAFVAVTPLPIVLPQPFSPARAIFTAFAILLAVCLSFSDPICISP